MIKKILPILALAAFTLGGPVFAESFHYSETEKAVFSFFKISRHDPNYETWINATPPVSGITDPRIRADMYEQESLRLKWGFGTFNVDRDFLKINTNVLLFFMRGKNSMTLNFMFPNSKPGEVPYFPYAYGNDWIALLIEDLANFTQIPLTTDEAVKISQYLKEGQVYAITLAVRARVKKADSAEPLMLDGVNQWIMSGEVGNIDFLYKDPATGKDISLWKFTAPWYLTDTEKLLMPLLNEGISNEPPSN